MKGVKGELLSVGIDLGTSTTQVILSRLRLENSAGAFAVPRVEIVDKEVVYRSPVHFTPLVSDTRLDGAKIREIVEQEYRAAGVTPDMLQTGAVIITGETARKENAREVLEALAGLAGDFVVATAGPDLESVLAARGAGADKLSERERCCLLHYDIGGGTSNLALLDRGKLLSTGCLDVGGRLVKVKDGKVAYVSEKVRRAFPELAVGGQASPEALQKAADAMAEALLEAGGLKPPGRWLEHFITHKTAELTAKPTCFSFSGGVADCVWSPPSNDFAYGDMGPILGKTIRRRFEEAGARLLRGAETIRATVVGAGSHATELSGSTIFYRGVEFPLKNLPVVRLEEGEALPNAMARGLELFSDNGRTEAVCFSLGGLDDPDYEELCALARGLAAGAKPLTDRGEPLVVAVEKDMAKALGQRLAAEIPGGKILCVDVIHAAQGSYMDVMAPAYGGTVLPVVIKTLAFETKEGVR